MVSLGFVLSNGGLIPSGSKHVSFDIKSSFTPKSIPSVRLSHIPINFGYSVSNKSSISSRTSNLVCLAERLSPSSSLDLDEEASLSGTELDFSDLSLTEDEEVLDDEEDSEETVNIQEDFEKEARTSRAVKRMEEGDLSHDFSSYRISELTVKTLKAKGIEKMTDVQYGTYDDLFDGRDMIARSRTGTGKTLAFGVPIVERLVAMKGTELDTNGIGQRRGRGPSCMILAPTRELASQVAKEIGSIAAPHGLSTDCFYGGSSYVTQERALSRGIDILVATPGRLIDHLGRNNIECSGVRFFVLDEADEMLSMGFAENVDEVLESLPDKANRQTILFSATVPSWVKNIARKHQTDPVLFDSIGSDTNQSATTVRHCAVLTPRDFESRAAFLDDIITVYGGGFGGGRAIVFTQTKKESDELATSGVLKSGAAVLHGDVTQKQREATLAGFRAGRFQVLVATDVAARGLDISGVDLVIQFRVPTDTESYIHRSGRTGRAGRSGTAVIMYSQDEMRGLRKLAMDTGVKFERHGLPSIEKVLTACAEHATTSIEDVDEKVAAYFMDAAQKLMAQENTVEKMAAALALISRRREIVERSILTGEPDHKTLLIKAKTSLNASAVMRMVNELADQVGVRVRLGKISICADDTMAVFDLTVEEASDLLSADLSGLTSFMIGAANEMPKLQQEDSRYGYGRYGGGGGYRGASNGGYRGSSNGGYRSSYGRGGGGGGYRGSSSYGGSRGGGGYRGGQSGRYSDGEGYGGRGGRGGGRQDGWRDRTRPERRSSQMY
mmetsp:Transcript_4478/g.7852  ORF Transcript_4478/g.7852 Transcript_4478/m.7852 type:complete len:783 (-) Transcript_4478:158-2506(-)